jgi:hypothetical protein
MTLRLCVIGNSHAAAYQSAVKEQADRWPGLAITVIGLPKEHLPDLVVEDGHLVGKTDMARRKMQQLVNARKVDLRAFDMIAVVGNGVALSRAMKLHQSLRWSDLPSVRRAADLARMAQIMTSEAAFRAMLGADLVGTAGGRMVQMLRAKVSQPLLVLSQPRFNQRILRRGDFGSRAIIDAGDAPALSAMFDSTARDAFAAGGATFVPQSAHTIVQHLCTATAYCEGALRLSGDEDIKQPVKDVIHANAAYGAAMFDEIAAQFVK